jgi:RNA polymerase sigma-70 factor (ECF subfamily)
MSEDTPGVREMIVAAREDPQELGELLENYRSFLLLMARRYVRDHGLAKADSSGLVQQTFVEACQAFPKFRGESEPEFSAWIKRIHRHNLVDEARRRKIPEQPLHDPEASVTIDWIEPQDQQTSPSQRLIRGEKALRLADALGSLLEDQAEAVTLRHVEGWKVKRIADHMGRSEGAVAGLLKRGLHNLHERMARDSWT